MSDAQDRSDQWIYTRTNETSAPITESTLRAAFKRIEEAGRPDPQPVHPKVAEALRAAETRFMYGHVVETPPEPELGAAHWSGLDRLPEWQKEVMVAALAGGLPLMRPREHRPVHQVIGDEIFQLLKAHQEESTMDTEPTTDVIEQRAREISEKWLCDRGFNTVSPAQEGFATEARGDRGCGETTPITRFMPAAGKITNVIGGEHDETLERLLGHCNSQLDLAAELVVALRGRLSPILQEEQDRAAIGEEQVAWLPGALDETRTIRARITALAGDLQDILSRVRL